MKQEINIRKIIAKINILEQQITDVSSQKLLKEITQDLNSLLDNDIDFKEIVDSIDESIFITDKTGKVLYVNPAYTRNTEILPVEVINKNVENLISNKLFTGGATLDVMKLKKRVIRLSTTYKTKIPRIGYTFGVPIFDENNNLRQIAVSSRPILTLSELKEDYGRFLSEVNINQPKPNIQVMDKKIVEQPPKLVGKSEVLKQTWEIIAKAAKTDATVLITGESGVGKEILADEIFRNSNRINKPFIKVNCASIPENLLESELFGYEKGAFSGANSSGKQGLFELANNGTLLLDEIGDMSFSLQAKLLRAIQNQEITRIGGTKTISLDIRFIAATNSNLKEKIAFGEFRGDLYYRLNVVPVNIPPLRERIDDIEPLCEFFSKKYSKKYNKLIEIRKEHIDYFKNYNWPGNIRELENVIEYLTICSSDTGNIDIKMIEGLLDSSDSFDSSNSDKSLNNSVESYEKKLIEDAIKNSKNLREAGIILNVNASTVSRKIRQYNINYQKLKGTNLK